METLVHCLTAGFILAFIFFICILFIAPLFGGSKKTEESKTEESSTKTESKEDMQRKLCCDLGNTIAELSGYFDCGVTITSSHIETVSKAIQLLSRYKEEVVSEMHNDTNKKEGK